MKNLFNKTSCLLSALLTLAPTGTAVAQAAFFPAPQADQVQDDILKTVRMRERDFLLRVCKLPEDKQKQVDAVGEEVLGALAEAPPVAQRNVIRMRGALHLDNGAGVRSQTEKLRKKLQDKYRELLDEEQKQLYNSELTAREEFNRNSRGECLIVLFNQRVSLKQHQIQPLKDALATWEGAESLQLSFYFQNGSSNYFPPIPAELYTKVLDADQLKVIRSFQQVFAQRDADVEQQFNW